MQTYVDIEYMYTFGRTVYAGFDGQDMEKVDDELDEALDEALEEAEEELKELEEGMFHTLWRAAMTHRTHFAQQYRIRHTYNCNNLCRQAI